MKNVDSPVVIIWGNDNYNVLGLIRNLVPNNISVFFLINGHGRFCSLYSKYRPRHAFVPTIDAGIKFLLLRFSNYAKKPILITTSDVLAEAVDQNKTMLCEHFIVMGTTEEGLLTKVLDKNYMVELAKKCNFVLPQSMPCMWNTNISEIQYPCLLKPNKNIANHPKEFKTKICNNINDLSMVLGQVKKDSVFVLQEYIRKEFDVLIYGCRMHNGDVLLPGALYKDRWCDGDGSHGYLTSKIPNAISIDSIKAFLEEIDYYGLFSFEFGLFNGMAYFYEVNLRNDGTSHLFSQSGANLPLAWVYESNGFDYTNWIQIKNEGFFIDRINDYVNVRKGVVSKKQWAKEKKEASFFKFYDVLDLLPYRLEYVKSLVRYLKNNLL